MQARLDRRIWAGAAGLAALATVCAAGQTRHMRRITADPEYAALRTSPTGRPISVRSADGVQLHVEVFGSESGQTFVLAHGWTEMLAYWTYVIRDLSDRGFRIVAYDLRGHGRSEQAPSGDYSLTRFGEDLEAVLRACVPEGERAVLAGHSLGAMSIAAWAEHHKVERRVGAAALVNTGVGDLIAEQLLIPVPWIAHALNRLIPPKAFLGAHTRLPRFSTPVSAAAVRYVAFGPEASPAQVAFYERMLVAVPPDVRANAGIAMSEMELYNAVPRLTVPTMVIAGADDRLTPPSHARRIAEMLPQLAKLIVLPDTGHMAPLERPREISEALTQLAAPSHRARAPSLRPISIGWGMRRFAPAAWRRVRAATWPVLLASLAAALAWLIAHRLLGHPQPFFAPIAAAIALSTSRIQRSRRIAQMATGVLLGIGIGEALAAIVGTSTVALGAIVFVTLSASLIAGVGFFGEGMMFANQAAASAILVVTLHRHGTGGERVIDAVVGGAVALILGVGLFSSRAAVTAARRRALGAADACGRDAAGR